MENQQADGTFLKECGAVLAVLGVMFLVGLSAVVTFCAVCMAAVTPSPLNPQPNLIVGGFSGIFLGVVAALLVVALLVVVLRLCGWRWFDP